MYEAREIQIFRVYHENYTSFLIFLHGSESEMVFFFINKVGKAELLLTIKFENTTVNAHKFHISI